jgi:penicillin-insensitive murein endopeptidase
MKFLLFILLAFLFNSIKANDDLPAWTKVTTPTISGQSQSIGKYHSGCISGAQKLDFNGEGYQVMRLSRNRYYGHPDLIRFIQQLGSSAYDKKLGTLLIGDLGQPRGGPTLTGHKSHQTGLDVDIWYLLHPDASKRDLTDHEREKLSAPSVLTSKGNGIDPKHWSYANESILETAARMPEVDRIFVNAHIKQALCQSSKSRDWLEKIRPWYAHADHFHVRLKCPSGNNLCEKQLPIPKGDGCGADLAWWFSDEAKKPSKKPPAKRPPLPKECDAVLNFMTN